MAKSAQRKRTQQRATARMERKKQVEKPEKKRPYTLMDCMKIGRIANILFVVFIVLCLIYYYSLARDGRYVIPFEVIAYVIETSAFVLFSISVIWIDRLVRARKIMKGLLLLYIVVEVVLMLLEFQFLPWTHYNGLSLALTITHVLFSAAVSFSLLMLEPQNKKLQWIVFITTTIILAGMFFGLAGYRVYASILVNAFAYIFFFSAMQHQLRLEEMRIDCYGDNAEPMTFSSTMFADTPNMTAPPKKKDAVLKHAKNAAEMLRNSEEHMVLTDKSEKFEYEFGVIEDDDDDEDDDFHDEDES